MPATVSKKIDAYIAKLPPWQQKVCRKLRRAIRKADPKIEEDWKWNSPAFSHDGLVCWFWGHKRFVSLKFFQGALIKDTYKVFVKELKVPRNRTIKYYEGDAVNEKVVVNYVKQAVGNNVKGKKVVIKPSPKKSIRPPKRIKDALEKAKLLEKFKARTYYQQKGYLQWIDWAKRDETKDKRIKTMLKELRAGTYMPPKKKTAK